MNEFEVTAEVRAEMGKGATRRLRRRGLVPAILYGAGKGNQPLQLDADSIRKRLENEAFFSHIITVKVDGSDTRAVVKSLDRDPVTDRVTHLDFLRISSTQEITMNVPLHFLNEDDAPGAREGGVISHLMLDVEVSCLPKDLPEYIEIDLGQLEIGMTVHLSEVVLPDGISLTAFKTGDIEEHDLPVVSLQHAQKFEEEEAEEGEDLETEGLDAEGVDAEGTGAGEPSATEDD